MQVVIQQRRQRTSMKGKCHVDHSMKKGKF
jgi:hypothetical protein